MSFTVLIPNVISILILLILLINVRYVSKNTITFDSKIFIIMVACNIIQCSSEILAFGIDGSTIPGFRILNLIVNSSLFSMNIVFTMLWVVYSDYKINEDVQLVKKHVNKLILPGLIIVIMSFVNLFVPVFFRITSENVYQRTSLFVIPYIVTYFYLAYGTVFIYKNKSRAKKYVFLPAIVFMTPILLGSLIQFFFYGFSTVWAGVAIALISVYLNLQNDVSYIDKLSGVYTRVYMFEYLKSITNKKNTNKKIAGIMLDIDDLKKINDTYGHLIGDEAICNAGKLLHSTSSRDTVCRYGGDEFFILVYVDSEEEVKNLINKIEKAELEFNSSNKNIYSLHFSKGYGIYDYEHDTIDSFLDRIDKGMYEEKKEKK